MFVTPLPHKPSQQGAVDFAGALCEMVHNSESQIYRMPEIKFPPDCEGEPGRITTRGPFESECLQLMLPLLQSEALCDKILFIRKEVILHIQSGLFALKNRGMKGQGSGEEPPEQLQPGAQRILGCGSWGLLCHTCWDFWVCVCSLCSELQNEACSRMNWVCSLRLPGTGHKNSPVSTRGVSFSTSSKGK